MKNKKHKINRYRKVINICIICLLTVFIFSCKNEVKEESLVKKESSATVTFLLGDVSVIYDSEKRKKLNINDKIKENAVIQTGSKSFATIQINEVGVIRINEKSTIEMKSIMLPEDGTTLELKSGSVFSKIQKKTGGIKYRVKTATMVAAVRGTQFLTIALGKNGQVLVKDGTVNVSTARKPDGRNVLRRKRVDVKENGDIKFAFQSRLQELTLEKYSLNPYIEDLENKSTEDIKEIFESIEPEEKKINRKIKQIEKIMLSPTDRLRKQGKPLVELFLRDGSEIIGSIEKTTKDSIRFNTGESIIEIPKDDIKRRISTK